MDVSGFKDVDQIPSDAVALVVWREGFGPQPLTIVVSRISWDKNKKIIADAGFLFNKNRIYEFESPPNNKGRKTIFHLQGVVGWAANVDTGIVSVKN